MSRHVLVVVRQFLFLRSFSGGPHHAATATLGRLTEVTVTGARFGRRSPRGSSRRRCGSGHHRARTRPHRARRRSWSASPSYRPCCLTQSRETVPATRGRPRRTSSARWIRRAGHLILPLDGFRPRDPEAAPRTPDRHGAFLRTSWTMLAGERAPRSAEQRSRRGDELARARSACCATCPATCPPRRSAPAAVRVDQHGGTAWLTWSREARGASPDRGGRAGTPARLLAALARTVVRRLRHRPRSHDPADARSIIGRADPIRGVDNEQLQRAMRSTSGVS